MVFWLLFLAFLSLVYSMYIPDFKLFEPALEIQPQMADDIDGQTIYWNCCVSHAFQKLLSLSFSLFFAIFSLSNYFSDKVFFFFFFNFSENLTQFISKINRVASGPGISGNLEKSGNFMALEKSQENVREFREIWKSQGTLTWNWEKSGNFTCSKLISPKLFQNSFKW